MEGSRVFIFNSPTFTLLVAGVISLSFPPYTLARVFPFRNRSPPQPWPFHPCNPNSSSIVGPPTDPVLPPPSPSLPSPTTPSPPRPSPEPYFKVPSVPPPRQVDCERRTYYYNFPPPPPTTPPNGYGIGRSCPGHDDIRPGPLQYGQDDCIDIYDFPPPPPTSPPNGYGRRCPGDDDDVIRPGPQ